MVTRRIALSLALALVGCRGEDPVASALPAGATLVLTLTGLTPLDATEGRFEAWVSDRGGKQTSLGNLDLRQGNSFRLVNPAADVEQLAVTYEPAGDTDPRPSPHLLLHGRIQGARGVLTVVGAVTQTDLELHQHPGQFTMFSPSDNAVHGYPSFEESGVWLFNMTPRTLPQNDMWVRLSQLQPGWTYEGWMVRDLGSPGAIWLSYGKFRPDATGAVSSRDDTGWGAYSGVRDFATAGEEEFPGDDWISNPLGLPFPAGLTLPLDLREKNSQNIGRWTHVITIEPASDRGEAISTERPFVIRPYRDAFGDGGPGSPRAITFRADGVPGGAVSRQ
ncbi:MAG: hypothetical protein ACT4P7_09550 [Gemmatimonadaceae bacterium]